MRLPAPDLLSTILLYIAAAIMAANQALSTSPALTAKFPALKMGGNWNYVPLLLLIVAFLIWVVRSAFLDAGAPAVAPATAQASTIAPVATTPTAPHPPAPRADRNYLPESFTQKYLELVSGQHTKLQIEALLRPHVGKWMSLQGTLTHVEKSRGALMVQLIVLNSRNTIFVYFGADQESQLSLLRPNDTLVFDARIVDGHPPELFEAELR